MLNYTIFWRFLIVLIAPYVTFLFVDVGIYPMDTA